MKKSALLISFALLLGGSCFAQFGRHWYSEQKKNKEKYFLSVGYGLGKAFWYSEMLRTSIYDRSGSTLESGTFKFRASNASTFYDLNVLCPVGNFRMGLGLNFEKFYLTKLELRQTVSMNKVVLYDESFRFDKIFVQFEIPFWPESRSRYSLSANTRFGFFSFNNVDRINLFGDDALASSVFITLSPVVDVQLYPGIALFFQPLGEFKYFKNPSVDPGGIVHHNIFTCSGMIGIRIDPNTIDELK